MDRIAVWTTVLYARLQSLKDNEDGQTLVEYGLIIALIAVLCITALTAVQNGVTGTLNSIANSL
jgi:pilus assembly protein Flp/PilA